MTQLGLIKLFRRDCVCAGPLGGTTVDQRCTGLSIKTTKCPKKKGESLNDRAPEKCALAENLLPGNSPHLGSCPP